MDKDGHDGGHGQAELNLEELHEGPAAAEQQEGEAGLHEAATAA